MAKPFPNRHQHVLNLLFKAAPHTLKMILLELFFCCLPSRRIGFLMNSFDVVGIAIFLFSSAFEPHAPWFPSILNQEKHGDRKDRSWAGTLQKIGRSPGVGYPSSPKILNSRKIWNMFSRETKKYVFSERKFSEKINRSVLLQQERCRKNLYRNMSQVFCSRLAIFFWLFLSKSRCVHTGYSSFFFFRNFLASAIFNRQPS